MRGQLAWTALTELLVMIAGVLVLKAAADLLGPAGFGEYTLTRRALNLMHLPLMMGIGIAAPRYIAIVRAGMSDKESQSSFVFATLMTGVIPALLVCGLLNLVPGTAAVILFGTSSLAHVIPAATVALAGVALHSVVYAVYRGQGRMVNANALQFVNLGIIPVAAFLFAAGGTASVLLAMGTAWLIFAGIAAAHAITSERLGWLGVASVRSHSATLLKFGLPRVPGEFALVVLFAIPALIAVRAHGVVVAGQFSAAISILTIAAGMFSPIGLVLLPRVSAQAAAGDLDGVRRLVVKVLTGGILLAGAGVAVGELIIPSLVRWYFGEAFMAAVPIFRACLVGAVPYVTYVLMRNILDAIDVKAVNSRNLIISLIVLVSLCLANSDVMWMAWSIVAALSLLGALTLYDTWLRLRPARVSA